MANLKKYVFDIIKNNKKYTLLGIGPMSKSLIEASLQLSSEKKFPIMYIASRNQVDSDIFGSGYVNNWNAERFVEDIKKIAKKNFYVGDYFICRDHGGPWQRDKERNEALPKKLAIKIAKESYREDILAGFNLLHIDPTKIPNCGSVAPMNEVIDMTIELIEYCEKVRNDSKISNLDYEIGTEETNGGLTDNDKFETFIKKLIYELYKRNLPKPTFIVGQTGTLVKMTKNIGYFDFNKANKLANIAAQYGIGFKEHNCDYIPFEELCLHPVANVTASNVAPEFGFIETSILLKLSDIEDNLLKQGIIKEKSNFYNIILEKSIKSERWKKWLVDSVNTEIIRNNSVLSNQILHIAGHYTFNDSKVLEERKRMYENLENIGLNPHNIVIEALKRSLNKYVTAFNLSNTYYGHDA